MRTAAAGRRVASPAEGGYGSRSTGPAAMKQAAPLPRSCILWKEVFRKTNSFYTEPETNSSVRG